MDSKDTSVSIFFFAVFLLCTHGVAAFNITRLLGQFPEYNAFNDLITQTKLYEQINRRLTITVLVVNNSDLGDLSGRPMDVVKRIVSNHVVLDYYDEEKLQGLKSKSTIITTLFQSSGLATNQQGFLNIVKTSSGQILFGSAVKGAAVNSKFVEAVTAQPYNISVLHISAPIIAPGIDVHDGNSTWTWKGSVSPSPAPAVAADPPAEASGEAPVSDAPADATKGETPAESPEGEAPSDDVAPGSAASDGEADIEAVPPKSSSTKVASNVGVGMAIMLGFLADMSI